MNALLELIREFLAFLFTKLFSLSQLDFLLSEILQHGLLIREPFVLFFVLSLAGDVLHLKLLLSLLSLELLLISFIHGLLQNTRFPP